jgi:hypothetical protein
LEGDENEAVNLDTRRAETALFTRPAKPHLSNIDPLPRSAMIKIAGTGGRLTETGTYRQDEK